MSRFRIRFHAYTAIAAVAGLALALGAADGAVKASAVTQSARSARIVLAPTAAPPVRPVHGAPIRFLPTIKPGQERRADFHSDHEVPPLADPHARANHIPVSVVNVPHAQRATRKTLILAAGLSSATNGLPETSQFTPSDDSSAAGPVNVIEQINSEVAIFQRTGATEFGPVSEDNWYGKGGDVLFDAHTLYDPVGQRFFTLAEDKTTNSWVVSVSTTSDATGSRCIYTFGALNSGATTVDFPLIAVNPTYLILTMREFNGNSVTGNRLELIPSSEVESCVTADNVFWQNVTNPGGQVADFLTPVMDYTASPATTYLINSYAGGGSNVSLWKINNSGSPLLSGTNVAVPSYSVPPPASQPGSPVVLDTDSADIFQAVKFGTAEYAALTTNRNGMAAVLLLKFHPDAGTLVDSTFIAGSNVTGNRINAFYPSVTMEADGDPVVTYDVSGPDSLPGTAVTALAAHSITSVVINQQVAQGVGAVPSDGNGFTCDNQPCARWGDYTSTYTDPTSINDFWSTGMWGTSSGWGTVIAHGTA